MRMKTPPTLDTLPDPPAIADDLERIADNLDRWKSLSLSSLRALPTIRFWAPLPELGELPERQRSNEAIQFAITGATEQFQYEDEDKALDELLDFKHPMRTLGERQEQAAELLSKSAESIRKSLQRKLLEKLANEMFRVELAWCVDQISAVTRGSELWYRMIEFERTVLIDPDDPRVQLWTTRILLRCKHPAQPIVLVPQGWSGSGEEPGELRVLSGPQKDHDPFRHRLLHVRPEHRSPKPFLLYIFDLGHFVGEGRTVELKYEQRLVDVGETFYPMIGLTTAPHPDLELIRFRVSDPDKSSEQATGYELKSAGHSEGSEAPGVLVHGYNTPCYVLNEQPIQRDEDGYFTLEVRHPTHENRYELWWSNASPGYEESGLKH